MPNKMVSNDAILRHLSNGEDFKPLARRAMASLVGNVHYVDVGAGHDGETGETFDRAWSTIDHAMDHVESDNNDYVLVSGWKTETGTGVVATLDVSYVHIIGHAGLMNPYYPEKGTLHRNGDGDQPYALVTGEFVELAGLALLAEMGAGTEPSAYKGSLAVGTIASGAGNKFYGHDLMFPDWNTAANTTGMTLRGCHYPVLETVTVESMYGNFDVGIYIGGSLETNSGYGIMRDIRLRGGAGGALATGVKCYSGSSMQNYEWDGVTHTRGTNMFNFGTASGAYCSFDNLQGDMTEANAFTGGSTCDNRGDLWTNYKATVGPNTYFRDNPYQTT